VILSGARGDYSISFDGSAYTVSDHRGLDGTDTVTDVENFQFSDMTLSASQLDLTPPVISSVSFGAHDGTVRAGESVDILVTFSQAVLATGTPTLTLNNGAVASLTGGSGTSTLTFTYAVSTGEDVSDLTIAAYSLTAGGASVKDGQGNPAIIAGA